MIPLVRVVVISAIIIKVTYILACKTSFIIIYSILFSIQLFHEYFGDNGTNSYKFATKGAYDSTMEGAKNKGNAIDFDTEFLNEPFMAWISSHELFHNWN